MPICLPGRRSDVDWIQKPIDTEVFPERLRSTIQRVPNKKPILHVEDDEGVLKFVDALVGRTADCIAAKTFGEAERRLGK